jgi:hypothetical protein
VLILCLRSYTADEVDESLSLSCDAVAQAAVVQPPKAAAGTIASSGAAALLLSQKHVDPEAVPAPDVEHPLVTAVDDTLLAARAALFETLLVEPGAGPGADSVIVGQLALSLAAQLAARNDVIQALQVRSRLGLA